ncbi:MAG: hypothetical protein JWM93_2033 [Frankiales bacterium]|nr:hypothetical protein [Frankiales bacterium]
MASVAIDTVWFNDAADLSDALGVEFVTGLAPTTAVRGEQRQYGDNRLRAVVRSGISRAYDVTIGVAKRADVRWIEGHVGRLLLIRDPMGRKFYGMYFDVKPVERRGEDSADVVVNFQEVTHSEVLLAA